MNGVTINHNKKRNVGIIYELLLRAVSAYLVEGNKKTAQVALDIISERFSKDSELFKEFRLFNALAKTKVTDSAITAVILTETKTAIKRIDPLLLDREKSLLIRDINHKLNDDLFYHRRISNYRNLATIQTALNEWYLGDRSDLSKTIIIETKLVEMMRDDSSSVSRSDMETSTSVDPLVVKIMNEKFNKKYAGSLTEDQRALIRDYVSMDSSGGPSKEMIDRASRIKESSLRCLDQIQSTEKNEIIQENLSGVRRRINELDLTTLDDSKLSKLMTLSQLIEESKEAR